MKTIVVPLDGSSLAEQALPAAQLFASLLNARVHLLRAVPDEEPEELAAERAMPIQYGGPLVMAVPRAQGAVDLAHRRAEAYLEGQAQRLRGAGFPATTAVCGGAPAELIAECAAAQGASLIALTTHGASGFRRWALGSVASKLVHETHVPILLTRSGGQPLARAPRRILLPLDGSDYARAALPLALDLARRAGAELVLLHAVPPQAPHEHARQHEALAALAATIGPPDVALRSMVITGDAAATIAQVAQYEQADLIVMATHGRSGLRRWALGSVADEVLHSSRVPLLLVRPQTY